MIYAGTVIKIEESVDGSPMYTVATPNGAVFFPCFMASSCGGFDAQYMMPPVEEGSEVVIANVNKGSVSYILGGIPDSMDQVGVSTDTQTTLNADVDYTGHHHTETVIRNTNSTINLSPEHDLTMKAPNVRLQLDQGVFRVSQQGASANHILNGQPFLDELFEYIAEMEARINALESVILAGESSIVAGIDSAIAIATTAGDLARITQLGIDRATFSTEMTLLKTSPSLTSSTVAKSECEATKNSSIKIP